MRIKLNKETRILQLPSNLATRANNNATGSTGQRSIEGYAATFNTKSKLLAEIEDGTIITFYEVLESNCFDDVLASPDLDCIYCIDHDRSKMISRTQSGTLSLSVDDTGLFFRSNIPNTTAGNDLFEHIQLGNYNANSFCFSVSEENERYVVDADGILTRYISKINGLYDVSSVINPAYNGTTLSLRGIEELKKRNEVQPIVNNEEQPIESILNNEVDLLELEIELTKAK